MAVRPFRTTHLRLAALGLALGLLAGCTGSDGVQKEFKPVPRAMVVSMERLDMKETSQIFIRIYKESSELEVWKQKRDGNFALLKTYEICKWSGNLGPKVKEGDRQAPEGFYIVTPGQMNPKSSYYLSFNIGYPNAFDRSLGRTGSNLMVHGACSSAGCYSMTDEAAGELFALARDSFRGGQTNFQIQALPFRMTAENLARHRDDPNMPFWKMLKVGTDNFDLTLRPPRVDVCDRKYVFNADAGGASFNGSAACPPYSVPANLVAALAEKDARDNAAIATAIASLDAKAADAATAEQAAAAEAADKARIAAEREQAAAERLTQPSMMTRLLKSVGIGGGNQPPPEPPAMTAAPSPEAIDKPAPKAIASVPVPRTRPQATTKSAPVPVVAKAPPAPAATDATATASTAPAVAPAAATPPAVGTFVKRKFVWPDDNAAAGGDTPG